MLRVCAWCGETLGPSGAEDGAENPVTHGMCPACSERLWRDAGGIPILEFLGSLNIPTFLLDRETRVASAGPEALTLLDRTQDEVAGRLGGEVLDCVNAELPGGCGGTELCSACTLRNTVVACFETGKAFRQVPTVLTVRRDGSVREVHFLLTTEKAGDRVLVQIEAAERDG